MRLRLCTIAILLTGSAFAADPTLLSRTPPGTQVIAGVNVEQVVASPFGQYFWAQTQQQIGDIQKLVEATGFDPRHDLREILVAMIGMPARSGGLVLARGTFNVPGILEAVLAKGGTVETYNSVPIIQGKGEREPLMAFPDSTLAILGDSAASVRAAIDRKSSPAAISAAVGVEVNQLSTTKDAWFISLVPPVQMQPQTGNTEGQAPLAILHKVLQASGGVKMGPTVSVTLKATMPTPQDAASLADVLKSFIGLASMGAANQQAAAASAALFESVVVSAEGSATNISMHVTEQQLEDMLQTKNQTNGAMGSAIRPPQ